jgi:DNA-binding IclR family transcriptional regulator
MGLLLQSRAVLEELAKTTKESAFVAVRKGAGIVPLDFVEPSRAVRVVSFLGTALPAHCTAAGKIYLVFESDGELGRTLLNGLKRYTGRTIVDCEALAAQTKEIGATGYAVEEEEFTDEVSSVAVPIRDYTRMLVGAMVVVGPSHRLAPDVIKNDVAPKILKAGNELSKRLGYPG